uniref:Uncharacterized protein n=1 Tax=Glossina pallidipes TaxID=7398 RepID=A0A1A9ZQA8_GLOPL
MKQWPNTSQTGEEICIGFIHSMLCLGGNGIILKYFSRLENYTSLTRHLPPKVKYTIAHHPFMSYVNYCGEVISDCPFYDLDVLERNVNTVTERELLKSVSYVNSSGGSYYSHRMSCTVKIFSIRRHGLRRTIRPKLGSPTDEVVK